MTTAAAVKPAVSPEEASRGGPIGSTPEDEHLDRPPLPPPSGPPPPLDEIFVAEAGVGGTDTVPVPEELTTEHLLTHKPKSD